MHLLVVVQSVAIISGIWPVNSENNYTRIAYNIYSTILRYGYYSLYATMVMGVVKATLDSSDVKEPFTFCILYGVTAYKWHICSSALIQRMIQKLKTLEISCRENNLNQNEQKIYLKYSRIANIGNGGMLCCVLVSSVIYWITQTKILIIDWDDSLLLNGTLKERPLPISAWWPLNSFFYLTYSFQTFGVAIATVGIIACDCIFATIIYYSIIKLKILFNRLLKISRSQGIGDEDAFSKLLECIENHQEIIKFVEDLDKSMKDFMLMDFLTHSLQMALTIYRVMMEPVQGGMIIFLANYLFLLCLQLGIFYWSANEMSYASVELGDAAYLSEWYSYSKRVRTLVLMIIMRSQKPLYLYVGPFFPMTAGLLLQILKAVGTLITFVENVTHEDQD